MSVNAVRRVAVQSPAASWLALGLASSGITFLNLLATSGAGTVLSPWTGWEAALNALPVSSFIFLPAGFYSQTARVTVKRGWIIQGCGKDNVTGAIITSAFLGTAWRTNFPLNSSNRANISVRDICIVNTNGANVGSGFLEVGGSYVDFLNVAIIGFRYGLALVQTEISFFTGVSAEFQTRAGIWIVNGGDYNPTYADPDIDLSTAGTQITNTLTFSNCQINQNGGVVGIADDGGETHTYRNMNFNGGSYAIRAAGVSPLKLDTCQFEGQALDTMLFTTTTLNSGTGVGVCGQVVLDDNSAIQTTPGKHAVSVAGGLDTLDLRGSILQPQTGAAIIGCININTIGNWLSQNPVALGLGQMYDVLPTHFIDIVRSGVTLGNVPFKRVSAAGIIHTATATLVGGTITVNTTAVTANSSIRLTRNTPAGALGHLSAPAGSIVPGVSFVINSSSATETSSVEWELLEKA